MEFAAEHSDQAVCDRLTAFVGLEMALGDVGRVLGLVDEHVIPRHVFRWTRSRHQLVSLVGSFNGCVDIEDDATVVEFLVMDDLAHEEFGRVLHGTSIAESDSRS